MKSCRNFQYSERVLSNDRVRSVPFGGLPRGRLVEAAVIVVSQASLAIFETLINGSTPSARTPSAFDGLSRMPSLEPTSTTKFAGRELAQRLGMAHQPRLAEVVGPSSTSLAQRHHTQLDILATLAEQHHERKKSSQQTAPASGSCRAKRPD